jgi:hypothetical protein
MEQAMKAAPRVLAAMLFGVAAGCGGTSSFEPASIGTSDIGDETYDLVIEFGSFAFLGPAIVPGGAPRGKIPAGANLGVSYVKAKADLGLTESPSNLEMVTNLDGQQQSTKLQNRFPPEDGRISFDTTLAIPAAATGEIQLSFRFATAGGEMAIDDNGGQGFRATILPAGSPILTATAPPDRHQRLPPPALAGVLSVGSEIRIRYDFARVLELGLDPNESSIFAVANFEDARRMLFASESVAMPREGLSPAMSVPPSAKNMKLFFRCASHGRVEFDSDHGSDFPFPVN